MSRSNRLIVWCTASVVVHLLALVALPGDGSWIEAAYARHFYPLIGPAVAFLPSLVPFSVAALLVAGSLVLVAAWLLANVAACRRGRLTGRAAISRSLAVPVAISAVVFHSFYVFWGYNYLRPSLEDRLGLDPVRFSAAGRLEFSRRFVREAASARVVVPEWDRDELDRLVDTAIARALADLEGRPTPVSSRLKGDLGTGLLALNGTHGFVSGSTLEAHVDFDLPPFQLAFTAAHEKAHLSGFARERDANFVAWYALTRSEDPRLRYAGYFGVIDYFLNAETRPLAGPVLSDREAVRAYSSSRLAKPVQRASQRAFGVYLRANGMPAGVGDYSAVWQLIQAFEQRR